MRIATTQSQSGEPRAISIPRQKEEEKRGIFDGVRVGAHACDNRLVAPDADRDLVQHPPSGAPGTHPRKRSAEKMPEGQGES